MAFIISPYRFVSYDADYQAILDRATTLGYTKPSDAQKAKQNTFVLNLKSAGIWSLLDVLYVFATDGDSDFATLNWKSPSSYQITKINTPTFTTNEGFDFNGTTQYLNTNWAPGTNGVNYTQNDASAGCYVNDNVALSSSNVFGCSNNPDGFTNSIVLNPRNASNQYNLLINDNAALTTSSITTSLGFHQSKRLGTSGTRKYAFKNGIQTASATTVSTSPPTVSLFIGASNGNGTATTYSSREISMFFAGSSLDTLENTFYTHWNTYFTSL